MGIERHFMLSRFFCDLKYGLGLGRESVKDIPWKNLELAGVLMGDEK